MYVTLYRLNTPHLSYPFLITNFLYNLCNNLSKINSKLKLRGIGVLITQDGELRSSYFSQKLYC